MIKCHIKKGGIVRISSKGKLEDLVPESLVLIQQIYREMKKQNPEAAEQYRRAIIGTTLAPNSPVWSEETLK